MLYSNPYVLVKILDKQWAEKLLDGEIFMRTIASFGDLTNRSKDSDNDFRGDTLEGYSRSFGDRSGLIDVLTYREKIFCLYALEYDIHNHKYIKPDFRLVNFGDTAVIIGKPQIFLKRICNAMCSRFGNDFWTSFMRVNYDIDCEIDREYNEFSKSNDYSWQKEFRIVLDLALGKFNPEILKDISDFTKLTFPGKIIIDINPESLADTLTLDIGDIRDIATILPLDKLLSEEFYSFLPDEFLSPVNIPPLIVPREPKPTFFKYVINLP